jgi:hypothetical protein
MHAVSRAAIVAAAVASSGCGVDCGTPDQVNGVYAVFANVTGDVEVSNPEAFPSYMSPANGWGEWTIEWDRVSGDVRMTVDDQAYDAVGTWDPIECGTFDLEFGGPYLSPEGTTHDFYAVGSFVVFANQLEGNWEYSEDWVAVDGQSGTFATDGQVSGERVSSL